LLVAIGVWRKAAEAINVSVGLKRSPVPLAES